MPPYQKVLIVHNMYLGYKFVLATMIKEYICTLKVLWPVQSVH